MERWTEKWENPFSPKNMAEGLIRAKFGGLLPETLTPSESIELMIAFAQFETARAECLAKMMNLATPRLMIRIEK
jgi:hypothetical protein